MTKTLKVIDPFLRLDLGDVLEQNESGDYVASVNEDFTNNTDDGEVFTTKYHASFLISKDYAKRLIEDGYLKEVGVTSNQKEDKQFVNVFDEIDSLIEKYSISLEESKNNKDLHPAIAREGEAVYTNLLTVLNHLKDLKK